MSALTRYWHLGIIAGKLAGQQLRSEDPTPKTKNCPSCPRKMVRHNFEYRCLCGHTEFIREKP